MKIYFVQFFFQLFMKYLDECHTVNPVKCTEKEIFTSKLP